MWSDIHHFQSVTSTNDIALSLAKDGAPHGTVVSAARQTKGRGRMGATWGTAEGCLAMSVLIRPGALSVGEADVLPGLTPAHATRLTLIAAVAVCEALHTLGAGAHAKIKWPNDIMLLSGERARKVCGILTELSSTSGHIDFAVLGIGINIERSPHPASAIPSEAAFLSDIGVRTNIEAVRKEVLTELARFLPAATPALSFSPRALATDFSGVIELWRKHNVTLGSHIFVKEQGFSGIAKDITPDGALVMQLDDGSLKQIYAGTF